jgi:four helix bundle suffix protein
MSNLSKGGYKNLLVYRSATTIYDATLIFCERFLKQSQFRRLVEQMTHAARSGKQNIVEGSLEKSTASNIMLTGVARASFGELLEDYKDFLRQRGLSVWDKIDPRILKIRAYREITSNETNLSNMSSITNINLNNSEDFANLMICLIYKECYLLDRLLAFQENNFIYKGGFRENLFKKRKLAKLVQ